MPGRPGTLRSCAAPLGQKSRSCHRPTADPYAHGLASQVHGSCSQAAAALSTGADVAGPVHAGHCWTTEGQMRTQFIATLTLASLATMGTCQPASAQYYESRPVLSGAYTPVEAVYHRQRRPLTADAHAATNHVTEPVRANNVTQARSRSASQPRSQYRKYYRRYQPAAPKSRQADQVRQPQPYRQTAYAPLSEAAAAPGVHSWRLSRGGAATGGADR